MNQKGAVKKGSPLSFSPLSAPIQITNLEGQSCIVFWSSDCLTGYIILSPSISLRTGLPKGFAKVVEGLSCLHCKVPSLSRVT
jgi:hypothetical protein